MDLLKIAEREKYADVFDMFCTNSFLPRITFPTRFAKHSCSLIDQIYYKPYTSSGTTNTVTAGIILSTISDHFPSFISLNIKRTSPKIPKFVTISRYTSDAVEHIRGDLIAENISQKMCPTHENNPNSMYDIFENCTTTTKQKHMPCISIKLKKHKHKLSNWISYGILHSIKCRDKLYKQLKTTHVDTPEYIRLKTNLDNFNILLVLIFSHFYVVSMCLMRLLHLARSCVSSLDNSFSDKSFPMLSIHLLFGFTLLLFPCTSIAITLLPTHSSSLISTCPYHFNLLSCTFLDISPTFVVPIILSFLILSSLVTPLIHLIILISATSNFFYCAFFTAQVSAPYIIAGLTTVLYTFPLTPKRILRSHRIPVILFQFFHPDCILCVISASKSPFSANVVPRYLNVFTRSKLCPCRLIYEFPSKFPSTLILR